jgi:hypothetical protein
LLNHKITAQTLNTNTKTPQNHPLAAPVTGAFILTADDLSRQDPDVLPLLPQLRIPPLLVWLVVHSEIRGNAPIRAVYDVLAAELPPLL